MTIYSHYLNKWAKEYIGKTVDEIKILKEFPDYKLHVINIQEEDINIDYAYEALKQHRDEKSYSPRMLYTDKFFEPSMQSTVQVLEYKGVIVDTKI
jgi:hypothetical protein